MIVGPVLVIGGLVALFVVLGGSVPDLSTVGWVIGIAAAGLLLLRASLALGPMKLCWRCKGKGHTGGMLGGRRKCSWCSGEGIRPRAGSGK